MCRTRGNCGVFEGVYQDHILTIVTNFQSKGDCLTVNIITDREIQCDYFSCQVLFLIFLSNQSQICKIDAMVTFL